MNSDQTTNDLPGIIGLSASEMARQIAAGVVSVVEVVDAHIARIEEVNPQINAVVQPLFKKARAAAMLADEVAVRARRQSCDLPPLHGVPVTVKDCFDVRGTDCTLGIKSRVGNPSKKNAPLVARMQRAGAIVLGKTNVHQGMLMHEANNPVFGVTRHPLDKQRTPGGSSGGEAAIIAAGGSPLGLASDLGGSIRQPAHACGLCGLKPTTGRLSNMRTYRAMPGMEAIALQPGPLARTVEDIDLAMRVWLDKSSIGRQPDESADFWPDLHTVSVEELRIGMFEDDGYFCPAPAVRRAVRQAAKWLVDRGATLQLFQPPNIREMMRIYFGLVSADGLGTLARLLQGGPYEPQVARQLRLGGLPRTVRPVVQGFLKIMGENYTKELFGWTGSRTVEQYWNLTLAADQYRQKFSRVCIDNRLDVILMPPHALPALRHGTALDLLPAASYCFLPNLLGWPAGVVPLTQVQPDEQSDRQAGRDRAIRAAFRVEKTSSGLPVGVQVLAAPWREDRVLAVMQALEQDVTANRKP